MNFKYRTKYRTTVLDNSIGQQYWYEDGINGKDGINAPAAPLSPRPCTARASHGGHGPSATPVVAALPLECVTRPCNLGGRWPFVATPATTPAGPSNDGTW